MAIRTALSSSLAWAGLLVAGSLLSCGGKAALVQTSVVQPVTLQITPADASLQAGGRLTLTAQVTGSPMPALVWAVDGTPGGSSTSGTVSGTGATATYTAPMAAGSHAVTATSVADPSRSASATVVVAAPTAVVLTLSPSGTVNLGPGGTQVFTATVTGSSNTSVGWLVDGVSNGSAAVGTLVGTGASATYSAPATAGSHTVTAFAAADTVKSASATVTVTVPAVEIALTPSGSAQVNTSGTLSFTASVAGTSNTAVIWSVDGIQGGSASAGTIAGSGLSVAYNAPASAGTHTVTATSSADTSRTASVSVSVLAPSGVVVTLAVAGPANVVPSGSMLITAGVSGASDASVTWAVDGVPDGNASVGTLFVPATGGTVVYTAPATTGSHRVTATSAAAPTQSASITIPVTATLVQAGSIPIGANVRSSPYNAAGDGVTDDTAAISAAVKAVAGTGKAVYLPAGTYLMDPTSNQNGGIRLGSNMTLLLDPQAILQARPTSTQNYAMVTVSGCSNVNISGGTFKGNNLNNSIPTPTKVEAGDCIHIVQSRNVVVEGSVVQDAFNDGIYVGGNSTNVTVCGITSQFNRRHGMAITYGQGFYLINSTFHGAIGSVETAGGPMVNGIGVDVEANANESVRTVLAANNRFTGNRAAGFAWGILGVANSSTSDVFVIGNTVSGNQSGLNGENTTRSWVLNNTVSTESAFGIYIHDGMNGTLVQGNTVSGTGTGGDGAGIEIYNDTATTVNANTSTGNSKYGLFVYQSTNPILTNNVLTGNGTAGLAIVRSTGVTQSGNTP
ncbi:right-handed parallel beta-helix repeat-containing protein [Geothrix sp. 21YS21S-2]|uniref:right-handed parallel beta-helix repeat-containing protein n=1 Tax=Geothrix sp. 21YS21S-2 TaxID=3068893 RepID=UPI0027BA6131|nr:right-handed parallel beta-helix repeat-containing protein [Geothrix sp. 21YS21S-2]